MSGSLRLTLICFVFCILQHANLWAAEKHRVLFVSAYHPAFPTFFHQVEGIKSVFDGQSILLDIEFMDTKRFPGRETFDAFHRSLAGKLSRIRPYDAIIVGDDNALSFALDFQQELFSGLPIVFLGVNNVELALEQNRNPSITGVVEAVSMQETLELMLKLHPDTQRIVALVDSLPSGQGDLKSYYQYADDFSQVEFSELSLAGLSFAEFAEQLQALGANDLVLLLSAFRDKDGKTLLFHDSLELIKNNLSRPLYHLWFHGMGQGVLGGKLISHRLQGRAAAEIVLEVLAGRPVAEIAVKRESPNRYLFDYRELERFGIEHSALPSDSQIYHQPYSVYQDHKSVIWAVVGVFSGYSLLLFGMWRTIQRRKQAEQELQNALTKTEETRDRIEAILTSVADGLIFTDMDNRIILLSASAEAILERKLTEVFLQPMAEVVTDQSLREQISATQETAKKETVMELELPARDQEPARFVQAKSSQVRGADGSMSGVITLLHDISRERELDRIKSEFISTAAHELRTPLTSVRGYAQYLLSEKGLAAEQQTEYLSIINEKTMVLEKIIDDLLDLSRVESGQVIHVEKGWYDLGPLLADLVGQYQKEYTCHRFETILPESPLELSVDKGKIVQVLENLLTNAVKFSPQGSLIQVLCGMSAGEVQISVRDEGVGMTDEQVERVFDKFYRVDSSLVAKEGLGLGMAICKSIIEAHGGKIGVETQLDKGTTVIFNLPLEKKVEETK